MPGTELVARGTVYKAERVSDPVELTVRQSRGIRNSSVISADRVECTAGAELTFELRYQGPGGVSEAMRVGKGLWI